jgi:hypothetical protein
MFKPNRLLQQIGHVTDGSTEFSAVRGQGGSELLWQVS